MFDIITSRDLLAKLEADFDDFMKEPHSTRSALNCAITAYHLHEWVWGDWLKTDDVTLPVLGISDCKTFRNWIERECPSFPTIQELTNATEHFRSPQQFETERVGAPPFTFDELEAGFDEGARDGPIPYVDGHGCLRIDYGEAAGTGR